MIEESKFIPDDCMIPIKKTKTKNSKKMRYSIKIDNFDILIPFANNPFPLYKGQRFVDMVESIRANGILESIIVRPYPGEKEKYEILSGHNRVAAAKEAGIKEIPAIVMECLTDEDALLIVTETNLIQRSITDMKPSELALVFATHYDALKKTPGYRTDLLNDIEELTCAPVGHRLKTRGELGKQYGLGSTTIARYLRINKLIPEFKKRLDEKRICMRVAEALSFLKVEEQNTIEKLLAEGKSINTEQAEKLKKGSKNGGLTKTAINEILNPDHATLTVKAVTLSEKILAKYFSPEQSTNEIEDIISKSLEQYYLNNK